MVQNEMLKKDEGAFSISLWLGIKCVNKTLVIYLSKEMIPNEM